MVQYLYADDWSTRWLWVPIVVNLYKETPSFTSGKSSRIYANALALFFFIISFSKGEHLFNGNQEVLHVPNYEFLLFNYKFLVVLQSMHIMYLKLLCGEKLGS